jgi:hypothetical protein
MANDLTTFEILLVKGGAFENTWELFQDDAMLIPTNLSGKSPRILVKFGAESIEWTVAGGHISVLAPATDGKVRIQLTTGQINALTFKAASAFLFLNGENELTAEGTITVK